MKVERADFSDAVSQGTVFIWDLQGLRACLEVQLKGWNMEDPASSGPEKLAMPGKGTICDAKPSQGGLLVSQGPSTALMSQHYRTAGLSISVKANLCSALTSQT